MLLILVVSLLWSAFTLAGPSYQVYDPWMPGSPAAIAGKSFKNMSFDSRHFVLGDSELQPGPSVLDRITSLGSQAYDVYESGRYDDEFKFATAWLIRNEFSIRQWLSSSRPVQTMRALTNSRSNTHVPLAMQPFKSARYRHQ